MHKTEGEIPDVWAWGQNRANVFHGRWESGDWILIFIQRNCKTAIFLSKVTLQTDMEGGKEN